MPIILPPISTAPGLTFEEIITLVSNDVRNKTIDDLIASWVNIAITELAAEFIFDTLHKYGSKITEVGKPDVILDSDFYWLKTLQTPTNNLEIYPIDETNLSESYPNYRTLQGTILRYYINALVLSLWQVPGGNFTLTYSFQKRPTKLTSNADVSDLPPEWHPVIAQRAMTKAYSYEGNDSGYNKSKTEETIMIKRLGKSVYRRLDRRLTLGTSHNLYRPGRPSLPPNYPRVW